jgi:hypothetical protein
MADNQPKTRAAKQPKGADALAQRMAGGLAAPAKSAAAPKPRTAARPAAAERPARKTSPSTSRAGMAAEQTKPPAFYSARISHTTTAEQLAELERVRSDAKREGNGAVSVTALLRAAVALCLDDQRLRARWIKAARNEWR